MKKLFFLILTVVSFLLGHNAFAQRVTDSGYRTVAYIKADGTIQDESYRTIGHADGIPMKWAAFYFFFFKV